MNDVKNICSNLNDSCFYYCSGSDATPIINLLDYDIKTFVYCDNLIYSPEKSIYAIMDSLKQVLLSNGHEEIWSTEFKSCIITENPFNNKVCSLSKWKCNDKSYYILFFIMKDIDVWKKIYVKNNQVPKIIFANLPECNNMHSVILKDSELPKIIFGHCWLIFSGKYRVVGEIKYYGSYSNGCSTIPMYELIDQKED